MSSRGCSTAHSSCLQVAHEHRCLPSLHQCSVKYQVSLCLCPAPGKDLPYTNVLKWAGLGSKQQGPQLCWFTAYPSSSPRELQHVWCFPSPLAAVEHGFCIALLASAASTGEEERREIEGDFPPPCFSGGPPDPCLWAGGKAIFHPYLISMLTNKGQGFSAVFNAVPALNNHPEM